MVRVCVLFAAGTNCDRETAQAFEMAGAQAETVHINRFRKGEAALDDFHILVVPGGFSYGDYISSGRILAGEIRHYLAEQLERFHASGRLILGICNGFQVLVKCGLLPAFDRLFDRQSVTLDWNDSGRYEDRWVYLAAQDSPCVFTRGIPPVIYLPVAHAEGKFIVDSPETLARLNAQHQVALRYVTAEGEPAAYPDNPNGSEQGVAGICDPTGRVFGLMPHPERFVRREQHPRWHRERLTKPDGTAVFLNAVRYAEENL